MAFTVESSLISKVLTPALRLWLRSQVETVASLDLEIEGKDRQILRGYVPKVALTSEEPIYRGLRLGQVLLRGENIRVNIGQVIKGKPLQLLEPIRVSGEVKLSQDHLQASLTSELLASAFREMLVALLAEQGVADPTEQLAPYQFHWQTIALVEQGFSLQGQISQVQEPPRELGLRARLQLLDPKTLRLEEVELWGLPAIAQRQLGHLVVELGDDVDIESLHLDRGELFCLGRLLIRP